MANSKCLRFGTPSDKLSKMMSGNVRKLIALVLVGLSCLFLACTPGPASPTATSPGLAGRSPIPVGPSGTSAPATTGAGTAVAPASATSGTAPEASPSPPPGTQVTPVPATGAVPRTMRIPSLDIKASIEVQGQDSRGVLLDPSGPQVVAWYDFSAYAGARGNGIYAGHLDYRDGRLAVFRRLKEIPLGAEITIEGQDGQSYRYRVQSSTVYPVQGAPEDEILGPSNLPVITLITCEGRFDQRLRAYDSRRIVRAVLVS